MEKNIASSRQAENSMTGIMNRILELSGRLDELEMRHSAAGADLQTAAFYRHPGFVEEHAELNRRIRQYAFTAIGRYLTLKKCGFSRRPEMLADLGRLTTRILLDIRKTRAALARPADVRQGGTSLCAPQSAGISAEIQIIRQDGQDLLKELETRIRAFSKHMGRHLACCPAEC